MKVYPRVLIIGTVPYNLSSPSRAFDSYFHGWDKSCLAQIFSNRKKPEKGHCQHFYQITDEMLLRRLLSPRNEVGRIYDDSELSAPGSSAVATPSKKRKATDVLYHLGNRQTPLRFLLRKMLWRPRWWKTAKLEAWVESFAPEALFVSFSNDFFIFEIALYLAEKYDLPIISSTGDDYYFNSHFSLSPFYHIYRRQYRKLMSEIMARQGDIIYISDKIRDKYNSAFSREGKTMYLATEISPRPYRSIAKPPAIGYFGNIRFGRNEALATFANEARKFDPGIVVDVYSNEQSAKYLRPLKKEKGIAFHGSIPYHQVASAMVRCDLLLIAEGFERKDVLMTRYSLSTKTADCLSSGVLTMGFGSPECGVIEYLKSTNAAYVATKREEIVPLLRVIYANEAQNAAFVMRAGELAVERYDRIKNAQRFYDIVVAAIASYDDKRGEEHAR